MKTFFLGFLFLFFNLSMKANAMLPSDCLELERANRESTFLEENFYRFSDPHILANELCARDYGTDTESIAFSLLFHGIRNRVPNLQELIQGIESYMPFSNTQRPEAFEFSDVIRGAKEVFFGGSAEYILDLAEQIDEIMAKEAFLQNGPQCDSNLDLFLSDACFAYYQRLQTSLDSLLYVEGDKKKFLLQALHEAREVYESHFLNSEQVAEMLQNALNKHFFRLEKNAVGIAKKGLSQNFFENFGKYILEWNKYEFEKQKNPLLRTSDLLEAEKQYLESFF